MDGLPRIRVVTVTFLGGLLIAALVRAGTASGAAEARNAEHNDVQAYIPSREAELNRQLQQIPTSASNLYNDTNGTSDTTNGTNHTTNGTKEVEAISTNLYWSMASARPAICSEPRDVRPTASSSQTTTPSPIARSLFWATTTTTTTAAESCAPCVLSVPSHYPLSGCPQELPCGSSCIALFHVHECMKPLMLHLSCPHPTEMGTSSTTNGTNQTMNGTNHTSGPEMGANSTTHGTNQTTNCTNQTANCTNQTVPEATDGNYWNLNLTLGKHGTWGDFAWMAFGGLSTANIKGPRLDAVIGEEDFDINCRVCSLDLSAVDSDPRAGYIRTSLSFGPNIFIQDSCDSPSMGPSLEPTMGPFLPTFSSSPSLGPSGGPESTFDSEVAFSSSQGQFQSDFEPSSGPVCKSASVYEDSIVGYAVFLVSSHQQGQPFYLDNSIAFIPKATSAAHAGADVDPFTNCGCPEAAYSVEVEAALPSAADYGDAFVFMVAPVLPDGEVVPIGVSSSLLQDVTVSTTTTTTREYAVVTLTGEISASVSDCEAYIANAQVQEAWDATIVELAQCPEEWVETALSCVGGALTEGERILTEEPGNLLVEYTIEIPSSVNSSSSLYNESVLTNGTNQTASEDDIASRIVYIVTLNLIENLDRTTEEVKQEVIEQQDAVGLNATFDVEVNEVSDPVITVETTPFTSTSTSTASWTSTDPEEESTTSEPTTSTQPGTTLPTTSTTRGTTLPTTNTSSTTVTTATQTTEELEQVVFAVFLTVKNRESFATDIDVLKSLTDTYAAILGVLPSQVLVSISLARRRLSTSYLMDPIGVVARLLTASVSEVGSVEMEIVATVPAGSGQTQVDIVGGLTEEGLQESLVSGLRRDGIDPTFYLPIEVQDISEAQIGGSSSTVSSTGTTSTAATTTSTAVTTPLPGTTSTAATSTVDATTTQATTTDTTTQATVRTTTVQGSDGGGSSSGGGGGGAAIAIAVPVALVLLVPACVGFCYIKRKREHEYEGSDEDYDFIADMQRALQESTGFLATLFTRGNEEGSNLPTTAENVDERSFTAAVPPMTWTPTPVYEDGWTMHDV